MTNNLFTPFPGQVPVFHQDLSQIMAKVVAGISGDSGERTFYRNLLITGHHGFGKTVLLTRLESLIKDKGWVSVRVRGGEFAYHDMLENKLPQVMMPALGTDEVRKLFAVEAYRSGYDTGWVTKGSRSVQQSLKFLADRLRGRDSGVVVIIDDAQQWGSQGFSRLLDEIEAVQNQTSNVVKIVAAAPLFLQFAQREQLSLPMVGERRVQLKGLDSSDVLSILGEGFEAANVQITPSQLNELVLASSGYPALLQALGYEAVVQARSSGAVQDLVKVVDYARRNVSRMYYSRIVRELDNSQILFFGTFAALSVAEGRKRGLPDKYSDTLPEARLRNTLPLSEQQFRLLVQEQQDQGYLRRNVRGDLVLNLPFFSEFLLSEINIRAKIADQIRK